MKIVGEIVAQEKLGDIPNKNIRTISGYPLITYSLYSFVYSKKVFEVYVLTNSEDVKSTMKSLKGVYDNNGRIIQTCDLNYEINDYEIKIHMKSSLINIYPQSIDKMIDYAIKNDIKLLRTFSEDFYLENKNGHEECLYNELNEAEKADIDEYRNLYSCHNNSFKVGYYTNGNNTRGLGHITRALDVADDFYTKPDIYYDINQTRQESFGLTFHKLIPVDGLFDLISKCKDKQYDIFITDILNTNIEYMNELRKAMPKTKLVNFEDDGEGAIKADLVFNALLPKNSFDNIYNGIKYYICDESYMMIKQNPIKDNVKKMFICFGGADPKNYTDRVFKIITKEEYKNFDFEVVLGKSKKNVDELMKYNTYSNIEVKYNANEIGIEMKKADVALTSRGNMTLELAILGIPTISIAQNENEMKHEFISEENGFSFLGLDPDDKTIEKEIKRYLYMSKEEREKIREVFNSLDLRAGRKRVMDLINFKN